MKPVAEMTVEERALAQRWVDTWKRAGPVLEAVRADEIRSADTVASMEVLDGMFTHAVQTLPPRESSGLIEQQRIFRRGHK